eukprot:scaffold1622_cov114-Skeletonema_menzelii.AAC.1
MGCRWGHYSRNTVAGHRNISTSSYAEQNHSSIKAMAPDDPNRTVEQNIVDIMLRDKTLIEDRQREKDSWYTTANAELELLTRDKSEQLSLPRKRMDKKPYNLFAEEFDHALQYSAADEFRNGVAGCVISHVSAKEGDGRFIPDGEKCKKCKESIALSFCRHDIVKCIHRGVPVFDPGSTDDVHLFFALIPRMRTDGTWVSTQAHGSNITDQGRLDGLIDDFNNEGVEGGFFGAEVGVDGAEGNGEDTSAPLDIILSSPSKRFMSTTSAVVQRTSAAHRRQVPFNTFVEYGKEIGGLARSLCVPTQHVISNHLQQVLELMRNGDYADPRHRDTCVERVAMLLASLAKDRSSEDGNMPNTQVVPKRGRNAKHRLGSEKSTVSFSSKKPRTCTFCKLQGCQTNTCERKREWGVPIKVTRDSLASTSDRLGQISQGSDPDFPDMAQVLGEEVIASKPLLDTLPQKTRHLQVKGFIVRSGKPYLFCTCVDSNGIILSRKEGSVT